MGIESTIQIYPVFVFDISVRILQKINFEDWLQYELIMIKVFR